MTRSASPHLALALLAALLTGGAFGCDPAPGKGADTERNGEVPAQEAPTGKVSLGHIQHRAPGVRDEGGPLRWTDTEGTAWEITTAYLILGAIELHLCLPEQATRTPGGALYDWLIPSARAHVPDAATRLGTPFVADLLGASGRARIVGEVAPPHGAYCGIVAVVAPADADVMNTSALDTADLLGRSLILRGRYRAKGADAWSPLALEHRGQATYRIAAHDPRQPPRDAKDRLVLKPGAGEALVLLDKTVNPHIFSSLRAADVARPTEHARLTRAILDRLGATLRVYRPGAPRTAPSPPVKK